MIRMLLDGMLSDIGYTMTAEAGALDEAMALAKQEDFDIAILDVDLHIEPITPAAGISTERGLLLCSPPAPTSRRLEAYRSDPTLQKLFRVEELSGRAVAVSKRASA